MEDKDMDDTEVKESLGKRIWKEVIENAKIFIYCFIFIYLLTSFVIKPIRVDGRSMYPTLSDGDVGITNVFAAKFLSVSRYDVVIVHNEQRDENWVKRIIALPHETIEGKDDVIYINGSPIDQPFLDTPYVNDIKKTGLFTTDFGPYTMGEDEYFLMGDNRILSEDSRAHGPFIGDDIVGKDALIIYPFKHWNYVHNTIDK